MKSVLGIHHVTAITADARRNLDFYTRVLGMRFVKRTVNFDDPYTYHFYFGDEIGSPGSLITFFVWPGARRGRQGIGQVATVSFAIPPSALGFWIERLLRHGIPYQGPTRRRIGESTEQVISFADPDGIFVELVAHPGSVARHDWSGASGIPSENAIRGLHSVTMWVEDRGPTEEALVHTVGLRLLSESDGRRRYGTSKNTPGGFVDVRAIGGFPAGVEGAGTVHHVAFRTGDNNSQDELRSRVLDAGFEATEVIDRKYFQSVYFRERGGVLLELATDGPGFTIDEPPSELGKRLQIPDEFAERRATIEALLPPLED